jgi:hypothetical protein
MADKEAARVLAWYGDDTGKSVLADALYGRDFMTQSGMEYRQAVIPLILIDYDFPEGLPRGPMVWGCLQDYLNDEAIRRKSNKASDATSEPAPDAACSSHNADVCADDNRLTFGRHYVMVFPWKRSGGMRGRIAG